MTKRVVQNVWLWIGLITLMAVASTDLQAQCASPHNTIMNQNNGQDGNMFNITALNDVTIDSVWCNFEPGTIQEVEIWYRSGTFVGFANAATGWIKIDSVINLPSAGTNSYTHVPIHINVQIPSGNTMAFYVTRAYLPNTGPYMRYTNGPFGSNGGQLYNQNTDIQVSYAYGKDYPFGTSFNPRIWNGRIFYSCCPTPPTPQGPITGDTNLCLGDTVTFQIPWDSLATGYEWTVPSGDTIISGQGDSLITMVVGPNSVGGQICVAMEDTCSVGPDTCISYSINQPTAPSGISGPNQVCQNNSAWYSTPVTSGVIAYNWTTPAGASIISSPQDSNAIHVQFGSASGKVCLSVTDSCAVSDTICQNVTVSANPTLANAGPDKSICTGHYAQLAASAPNIGSGVWSIVSSPGPGTFTDTTAHNAKYFTSAPGQHVLRWTTSSAGCPSTSDIMVVNVGITPTANFTTQNVCEGAPVGFQDLSSGNGATITSWLWDMDGDGVDNHITQNPIHSYSSQGTYNVRLIVNAQGCSDTLFKNVFVNPKPILDITADDRCFQQGVQFENNSSIPSGVIDSIFWNFGDGSGVQASGLPFLNTDPLYMYGQPGTYNVTHTAKSDSGCVSTTQLSVDVFHLPVAQFEALNSCQFQTTEFVDQSTVTNANLDSWAWDFGDGSDSAYTQDAEHDYTLNGFVPVTLKVWSDQGCYDDTVVNVEIYPTPATDFNYTNKVCLGSPLELDATTTIAYGSLVSHEWMVADSFEYTGPSASHMFDEIGMYTVSLTSESNQGCRSTEVKEVPVYEVPFAHFTFESECKDVEVSFRDSSTFSNGALKQFTWDFGDGSPLVYEQYTTHAYDTHGVFDVTFVAESYKGCVDSVTYPVEIYERVIPRFAVMPDSGCSPYSVEFVDTTKSHTGRDLRYVWMYGDGFMREDTAYYTYINTTGKTKSYDVTLMIYSDQGCVSHYTMDSAVTVLPQPIASFEADPDLGTLTTADPLVQFKNTSYQANWYVWTFGDGERSNAHNPAHEYKYTGEYDVMLVARNVYQCRDTMSMRAIVEHANIPFIPKAFTPNGDGKNEVFKVHGLQAVTDFEMYIFDRWGNEIYAEKADGASWDGRNNQNKLVQQGAYTYRIKYTDKRGEDHELIGTVAVLGVE